MAYVLRKRGSQNWFIRLQRDGKDVLKSLGTPDRKAAEILALPLIAAHKAALMAARPHLVMRPYTLPPGEYKGEQGERVIATERDIIYFDSKTGALLRTKPNSPANELVNRGNREVIVGLVPAGTKGPFIELEKLERPSAPTKGGDDAILDTYFKHRNVTGYNRREAEAMWALYKEVTGGKPIKDATRDDGRKLVQRFKEDGNKSATINKKIGWLRAAVKLAIDEGKLKFNPFANIVPKEKQEEKEKRLPLDAADMKAAKRNLNKLTQSDALLFRLLASTGMRLSEAFEIDGEAKERGIRYVIVGSKTEQSKRRIPLPADVLPHLPKKIDGHLFGVDTRAAHRLASKRLNRFLRDFGIVDPRKVTHSLRHRAQDRLRAAGAPQDIREALLGHSKLTVGEGYGVGFPVKMLKEWIDKIGC